MSRESLSVLAGLAVMVAGLVVFFGASVDSEPASESPIAVPVEEWAPPAPTATATPPGTPEIPGVPVAVASVLMDAGGAEELGAEDLTDIDPAVARVLIAYGATLRVPVRESGGQVG